MGSRFDNIGLLWQDIPAVKEGRVIINREPPPVPITGWTCPEEFPRLKDASMLCIDVETCDTGIRQGKGPGEFLADGYICGIAVAVPEGQAWYFPMRHQQGANLDPDTVIAWAKDALTKAHQPKLFTNALYDLGWLAQAGIKVPGPYHDIQIAEPLLDEHALSYSLETLSQKYLGEGKESNLLYNWLSQAYGGTPDRKHQGGRIHLAPATLVGPYAESDVRLPLQILTKQKVLLKEERLLDLYNLECRLLPMLLAMRRRGVPVDLEKASLLQDTLKLRITRDQEKINQLAGNEINIDAAADLERLFLKLDLPMYYTAKGNPSFTKEVLQKSPHEACKLIQDIRRWSKFENTFIKGIFSHAVNGKIHCSFHPLRTDENGTISGRLSSSKPNLQNQPSRDKELAPLVRGIFVPEKDCVWQKDDYSQIEYRLFLHYASGTAAEKIRQQYRENPATDYHALVADWSGLDRTPAKGLNFGVLYGLGEEATASNNHWTREQAKIFLKLYHEKIPFARPLLESTAAVAEKRGYVKTLLGRRSRFVLWEPRGRRSHKSVPFEQAQKEWPGQTLKRAFGYTALNRILQGSAADIMKKAMVDIWESGVCEYVDVPHLTVHDELDWSVHPDTAPYMEEVKRLMEHTVELKLPLLVDSKIGESWGAVE